MFNYSLYNIEIFVKHLKSAERDPLLSKVMQEDAQDLIVFFTQKISKSKQDPHLSALDLVSFSSGHLEKSTSQCNIP
jgi:adenylate kinase